MKLLRLNIFLAFLFILFSNISSFAQTKGTLLVVCNDAAVILVDGESVGNLINNNPTKFELNIGEHFVQARSVADNSRLSKGQIVTIESGKQKVIQLEFEQKGATSSNSSAMEPITVASLAFTIPGSLQVGTWMNEHPNQEYP